MEKGLNIKDGFDFIKNNLKKQQEDKSQAALQPKNIIEEHAPEVYEMLKSKIGQGLKPLVAAFQLSQDSKHKKKISELQKKTGKNFSDLVTSIFGSEEKPQEKTDSMKAIDQIFQKSPQSQAALQSPGLQTQMPSPQQPQQIPGQPQANNAASNDALMQAFQKILNM